MISVTGYINGDEYKGNIIDKNGKQKCPVCQLVGKKHINDTPLSVNTSLKVFNCHKCRWKGHYGQKDNFKFMNYEKKYEKPDIGNQTELKDNILQHFSKRLIKQETLIRNKVKSAKNGWFAFTYYDGEEVVKIKYKTTDKKMMQSKNSKPWIYKYNDLVGQSEVMICEGEEETLIWEQAGFKAACSVDMGAPNEHDKNADAKLQCIVNCFDVFEDAEFIYLAVDNDANGKRLEKELINRFGADKCKLVDFKGKKDANDFVFKYGFDGLMKQKENASDIKVDGIFNLDSVRDEILNDYLNGQPLGSTTYFPNIDPCWKWRLGEVNVWTGYNNEGKSLLIKQLQICKSIGDGWKHAVFSPEEFPLNEWYTDLIESFIGKSADKTQVHFKNYMTRMQLNAGMDFINEYFYNILPEKDHSIELLLKKFSYCVRRYGVKTITFDPYNQIHHLIKSGERDDLYISRFMSELKRFAITHNVSVNLVAHQVTPTFIKGENYPEPNLYKVKGGGTFADKADNVLAVWRENRNTNISDNSVTFISQKIKKQKLTGIPGRADLLYDRRENRYYALNECPIANVKIKESTLKEGGLAKKPL